MITKRWIQSLMVAGLMAMGTCSTSAATFTLNLTGTVNQGQFSSFDDGTNRYDQWVLPLTGLDALNAITLSSGDTVNAVVTLSQVFKIPPSGQRTNFAFSLSGASFPAIDTETTGSTTFFNVGVLGISGTGDTTTSGQLVNSVDFFAPNNAAVSFNRVISRFDIAALASAATVDHAQISYTLVSPLSPVSLAPVPEPETFAMLLAGLALVGTVVRRRSRTAA